MAALLTFNPCETEMKIPALQIPVNDFRDIIPPETETGGVLIVPYLFQFLEMGFDACVISTGTWVSWLIYLEVGHGLWHEI